MANSATKPRRRRTAKILALIYAVPAMIGLLNGGCSMQMMSHGWEVKAEVEDTAASTTASIKGYSPPELLKLQDGSVEIHYDVQLIRLGALGPDAGGGAPEPKLVRRTRRISAAMLTPPTAFPGADLLFMQPDTVVLKQLSSQDALVRPTHSVPEEETTMDKSGRLVFPDRECFLSYDGYLLWYIPPPRRGELPRVALLATDEYTTPAYAYPLRIICFPFFVCADGIFWPIYFVAAGSGKAAPL